MKKLLFFFEDDRVDDFYPLSLSHTVAELQCGILSLGDKWSARIDHDEVRLIARRSLQQYLAASLQWPINSFDNVSAEQIILVNPRFLPTEDVVTQISEEAKERAFTCGEALVAMTVTSESGLWSRLKSAIGSDNFYQTLREWGAGLPHTEVDLKSVRYLWDIVHRNSDEIAVDFDLLIPDLDFSRMLDSSEIDDDVLIYNVDDVYIGTDAQIDGQVVIDARPGPIYIGDKVQIFPHSRIEGPAYIGDHCQIVGGKIRTGCSFGPHCRIGGEVEESIFLGHSNKYHDGFIGHAYIGEWVNLGALTTNSDLKNNYGNIKVELPSGLIDTGFNKVGCMIGDHTKTGIGTLLTTGMVIGFATNLFGGGLAGGRFLPSFMWGGRDGFVEHRVTDAIETAKIVLSRRGKKFGAAEEQFFKQVFEQTQGQREKYLRKSS
jgi:UDP-N-acetylglucosamine diphosphorylase / glucose-1-phosphate thymidylyltransferase / UDP-N-acetylgalactosamine diphosphorylase / glucosamine-1-phosphate N-acetyltransferase / galactosamine-1-phosphate N-acetyltransferase